MRSGATLAASTVKAASNDDRRHGVDREGMAWQPRPAMPSRLLSLATFALLSWSGVAAAAIDGTRLAAYGFVASRVSPRIAALDLASGEVAAMIELDRPAHQMAVAETQAELIVGTLDDRTIAVVDLQTLAVVRSLVLDHEPEHIQISPDGQVLAVGNFYSDALTLVDLAAMSSRRVTGLAQPHNIVFDADGRRLFVANLGADEISVIDIGTGVVSGRIVVPRTDGQAPGITDLVPSRDGRRLVAIPASGAELISVDTRRGVAIRTDLVGPQPWMAALTGDGRMLLSANVGDATLSLVDAAGGGEIARLPGSHDVIGLLSTWFGTVAVLLSGEPAQAMFVDLAAPAPGEVVVLPSRPLGALPSADGARIYVTLTDGDALAVLDPRQRSVERVITGVIAAPGDIVGVGSRNICD